jgi:3-oxoacyl-[acyl-carrier-protein] synthase-3
MALIYGRITGWGHYAPAKILTNAELAQIVDTSDEWIVQRSGIRERRIAAAHETTASMVTSAGLAALRQAGLVATDLDLIIVATSTPDYHTPPVSSLVQHAIGAPGVPAFVVETGCTGFVYALTVAYQFIQSGAYRTVLVIGVELLSRFINWQDRTTCVLFGDAAGAVVVQATQQPCGLRGFELGSDGSQAKTIIMPGGGSARPLSQAVLDGHEQFVQMNGREVFKFATRVIGDSTRRVLQKAELSLSAIDWIIPHQANLRILQAAAQQMAIPLDRFIINIARYGNTSAASIPLALSEAIASGHIQPGQRLLLTSFGAGLTWATAILDL